MDQENSFIEEINENDLKDERLKKVLVVLITVAILGGTYYFTSISNKKTKPIVSNVEKQAVTVKPEIQKPKQSDLKDLKNIKVIKKDQSLISDNYEQSKYKPISGIKPTNKTFAAKAALLAAGKSDPFSGGVEKSEMTTGLKTFLPKYIGKNPLSIPPSVKDLPSIGSLPNLNVPNSNLIPGKMPFAEIGNYPEVKGFIGNKVILSINGVSESLKTNESFQGIRVVKVDPQTMTVKYIQDKKVITKTIKGLN